MRAATLPQANAGCTTGGIDRATLEQAGQYVDSFQPYLQTDLDDGVRRNMLLTAVQVRYLQWIVQPTADRNAPDNPAYAALNDVVNAILRGYNPNKPESTWAFSVMEAHYFRALAENARGQFRDALDDCDAALEVYDNPQNRDLLEPDRAMTVYGLKGFAYDRMGSYTEAVQAYGEALDQAKALNLSSSVATYQQLWQNASYRLLGTQTITPPTATSYPEAMETAESTAMPQVTETPLPES